jgi:oxepin-CoA hydrolase/3-oxo-5,6-dehydrosuberyl-CoA semialdehyde dehydrogenase
MQLESYVAGAWRRGTGELIPLRDASTSEVVATATASGVDLRAALEHARASGGPQLRRLTFHERAALLKRLAQHLAACKEELYELSHATGATRADSWLDIDGGITTLFVYAGKGLRELPDATVYVDGDIEILAKSGGFVGQHIFVPRRGAALHINAFNFPVWGMLEKLAPALLAGVPAIVKPATQTAYLAALAVRRILESGLLPEGSIQLLCGSVADQLGELGCEDTVAFTGSARTAQSLRRVPAVIERAVRVTAETDSLNSTILGPDATPGTPEFAAFVREVVREMTVKAGQKCTAIRKALVPITCAPAAIDALRAALEAVTVGDPRLAAVRMGPLASLAQRAEVLARLEALSAAARVEYGGAGAQPIGDAASSRGAFIAPTLLYQSDTRAAGAQAVHEVEAFGPICTLIPYDTVDRATELARRGAGSLVGSIFSADESLAARWVLELAPLHGRILVVDRRCAEESTGHGSPLPHLVHGGPGRAGGGEELGGIRGVLHYMQRSAIQGTPDLIAAVTGRWVKGARRLDPGVHPFRKSFHALAIGDGFESRERELTLDDIERFADLSGDRFYAHMDEEAARRNPLFGGRVAHGYLVLAAAAGLFVDPAPGPVLANYGIDSLRFLKPVRPGDRVRVRLVCKQKSLRAAAGYGEVRWDAEIVNQDGERVAAYDVLTMVAAG